MLPSDEETTLPKFNDTQLMLLATASQRDSRSFFPLPAALTEAEVRATKAVAALIKRGLAEERQTNDAAAVLRTDGNLRFGMFITNAGIRAIERSESDAATRPAPTAATRTGARPARRSKTAAVIDLLRRPQGTTLTELIEATGWLPHTTRAALTGLRKKGHTVERSKRSDVTCYRVVVAETA